MSGQDPSRGLRSLPVDADVGTFKCAHRLMDRAVLGHPEDGALSAINVSFGQIDRDLEVREPVGIGSFAVFDIHRQSLSIYANSLAVIRHQDADTSAKRRHQNLRWRWSLDAARIGVDDVIAELRLE